VDSGYHAVEYVPNAVEIVIRNSGKQFRKNFINLSTHMKEMRLGHSNLSLKMIFLTGLISLISIDAFASVYGDLSDELDKSTVLIRENTRSLHRFTEFIRACTSLAKSGDLSITSTCDSVIQKFNIEIAKFQKNNQLGIEDLIYPYTIPADVESMMSLDSSIVIGSSNPADLVTHGITSIQYNEISQKVIEECTSSAELYNIDQVGKCIGIFKSLNDYLRNFNTNAGAEINKVLDLAKVHQSESETGTSGFDLP